MARTVELDSNMLAWTPTSWPGISRKLLRSDPATGARASLLKLEANARLPRHLHPAGEEVFDSLDEAVRAIVRLRGIDENNYVFLDARSEA